MSVSTMGPKYRVCTKAYRSTHQTVPIKFPTVWINEEQLFEKLKAARQRRSRGEACYCVLVGVVTALVAHERIDFPAIAFFSAAFTFLGWGAARFELRRR